MNSYGFQGLSDRCADKVAKVLPDDVGQGHEYNGIVESNAYAVATLPNGDRVVADAAGNSLLRVKPNGHVSTLAVLPVRPETPTKELAESLGLPKCVVGHPYNCEFVPTDVELGPDGELYVTSLPGGPEDDSLGARGAVSKVNPYSGHARMVADGFLGATGLAITDSGRIYVAEIGANQISMVVNGKPKPVVSVTTPAAIEEWCGTLSDVFGNGTVAKLVKVKDPA